MNQRGIAIASIGVLVLAIAVAIVYYVMHPQQTAQVQNASKAPIVAAALLGGPAPEFEAATTAGPFDLAKAKGPVFLEIFATWCPHCQRETTTLNRLFATYGKRIHFLAVSGSDTAMDGSSEASQADVLAFVQRFNVQYPVAYDGTLTVGGLYLQGGFPTMVVIDSHKQIRYLSSGEVKYDELAAAIAKVL